MSETYETEFVVMRDAYNFERNRANTADAKATLFAENLVSVMEKLGVINAEDITSDAQFLCAVDGWFKSDSGKENERLRELLEEAECPNKCNQWISRLDGADQICPFCTKRNELLGGDDEN